MLDTGCTLNTFNDQDSGKETLFSTFLIDHENFGPVEFYHLPLNFPVHIEAVLGMEFFKDHMVFIDFQKECAYFAKSGSNDLQEEAATSGT